MTAKGQRSHSGALITCRNKTDSIPWLKKARQRYMYMSTLFRPCDASKAMPRITCVNAAATVALPEPAPVAAFPSAPQAISSLQLDRMKEDYEGLPVANIMDVLCIFWNLETLIAAMKCVNFCALDKVGYSQRRAANCLAKNQHSQAGSRKKAAASCARHNQLRQTALNLFARLQMLPLAGKALRSSEVSRR